MSRSSASAPRFWVGIDLFEFMLNYCLCESILIYESPVGQKKKCCREDSSFHAGSPPHQQQS
jgi:hypothetical protein